MTYLILFILYAIILSVALSLRGHRSNAKQHAEISRTPSKRILIIGATGGTGRQLVDQALERGYVVTALARNPSRLQIDHPQLTVLQGDVLDNASLDAAIKDQDAVLCALGHKRFLYPTRILSQGTRNILQAMKTHHVTRLVCETALGIGDSAWRMGLYYTFFTIPLILPFYFWDKTRQEQLIAESDVEWIIVRPGTLNNGKKRDRIRHGYDVGNFLWTVRISRADVAGFMLNQLESDSYIRRAPGVTW